MAYWIHLKASRKTMSINMAHSLEIRYIPEWAAMERLNLCYIAGKLGLCWQHVYCDSIPFQPAIKISEAEARWLRDNICCSCLIVLFDLNGCWPVPLDLEQKILNSLYIQFVSSCNFVVMFELWNLSHQVYMYTITWKVINTRSSKKDKKKQNTQILVKN